MMRCVMKLLGRARAESGMLQAALDEVQENGSAASLACGCS